MIPMTKMIIIVLAMAAGCFVTKVLILVQKVFLSFCFSSTLGIKGQKAGLPNRANILGINVNPASKIKITAVENTGAKRSEEHTSELQSRGHLVCRLLHDPTLPAATLFPYTRSSDLCRVFCNKGTYFSPKGFLVLLFFLYPWNKGPKGRST